MLKRGRKLAGHHHHCHDDDDDDDDDDADDNDDDGTPTNWHPNSYMDKINVNMSTHAYQHVQLYS